MEARDALTNPRTAEVIHEAKPVEKKPVFQFPQTTKPVQK